MEKTEKAMERRGASIVWAGRGVYAGILPMQLERIHGAGPALSGGREIPYRYG